MIPRIDYFIEFEDEQEERTYEEMADDDFDLQYELFRESEEDYERTITNRY